MYAPAPPPPSFPQYQGGSSFAVFTAQGSNPGFNCKIFGKSVHRVYDKTVKGYVYNCLGGMSSKIQFPKDEKAGLQLVQPYLVLQIFVPKGQHFSLELRAADTQGTRRKMYFSTSFSDLKTNPLHCQVPLSMGDIGDPGSSLSNNGCSEKMLQAQYSDAESAAREEPTISHMSHVTANSEFANQTSQATLPYRSGNERKHTDLTSTTSVLSKVEDQELDLLYDPILDCYYDPKTNRYYELR